MTEGPNSCEFDYNQLAPDLALQMRGAADRVRQSVRASIIDVGRELLQVKERLEHGQFVAWVERECQLRIKTAERRMRAADVAKNDKLSYLPPDGLLALSARSAPATAVDAIMERIDAGEQPTAVQIKREIAVAKRQLRATRPDIEEATADLGPVANTESGEALAAAETTAEPLAFDKADPTERHFAELMQVWDLADPVARQRFLAAIGARMSTMPGKMLAAKADASSDEVTEQDDDAALTDREPRADAVSPDPRRLFHDPEVSPPPLSVTDTVQPFLWRDATSPPAVIVRSPSNGSAPMSPADDGGAEPADEHLAAPPVTVIQRLERADDGGGPASWVGSGPPPKIACNSQNGRCRYADCSRVGHCVALPLCAPAAA